MDEGGQLTEGKKGVKNARFDLLPADALWAVSLVFGEGAKKYAERNWERGYDWSKSYGALLRHLALFWQGEDKDPESGLPHLSHVAWHALVLTAFYQRYVGNDDRPLAFDKNGFGLDTMQAEVTNPGEVEAAQLEVESRETFTVGPMGPLPG